MGKPEFTSFCESEGLGSGSIKPHAIALGLLLGNTRPPITIAPTSARWRTDRK